MQTGMICNCKQVSYADVENALHQMTSFSDVLEAFDEVQKVTHCSTGCGGCHDKILDAISEIMMKQPERGSLFLFSRGNAAYFFVENYYETITEYILTIK